MSRRFFVCTALLLMPVLCHASAGEKDSGKPKLSFDPGMFKGVGISAQLLEQFNANRDTQPGTYRLDIVLNGQNKTRKDLELRGAAGERQWICTDNALLKELGIKPAAPDNEACADLVQLFPGATEEMDSKKLQLRISIPQVYLDRTPRGQVSPEDLDAGITALTLNYLGNYQLVHTAGPWSSLHQTGYLSLSAGMNFGALQFRQQGAMQYESGKGLKYKNLRSYVQRPLPDWGSEIIAGQTFTSGRHFPSLSFNGVNLRTDERMLPDSMRGFAPVVRGVAQTNATVTIRQNGFQIYQTTVAPGSFEIQDLYPTSLSGDLEVDVKESDGITRSFTVPFSAVPESLRPGAMRYDIAAGRTRGTGDGTGFIDAVYSRGFSNSLTGTTGLRLTNDYRAGMLGGVFNSSLGAVGAEFTYAATSMDDSTSLSGWKAHLSYSRKIQTTNTVITLAGYRYSTEGYRELPDMLAVRSMGASAWSSATYMQRDRYNLNVNQPLGEWGSVYMSASTGSYRNGREDDKQIQLGYSKSFRTGMSLNFTLARQRVGLLHSGADVAMQPYGNGIENTVMVSVSFPLESITHIASGHVSLSASHSANGGDLVQSTYSGMSSDDNSMSYSLTGTHVNHQQSSNSISANAQKRFSKGTVGVSASHGKGYWQAGASVQGAAVVHAGGITLGSYLGDTAALIEVQGAEGARIWGGVAGQVDKDGFALVPSVIPYRYNSVSLDPQNMTGEIDLLTSEKRVAPYAGALVKLKYETRGGQALLIRALPVNGTAIPMGSDVHTANDEIVSMVGQGNQIYLRTEQTKGRLIVRWGQEDHERCVLDYAINEAAPARHIPMLELPCR